MAISVANIVETLNSVKKPPCEGKCKNNKLCSKEPLACKAFSKYVSGKSLSNLKESDYEPNSKTYKLIFCRPTTGF